MCRVGLRIGMGHLRFFWEVAQHYSIDDGTRNSVSTLVWQQSLVSVSDTLFYYAERKEGHMQACLVREAGGYDGGTASF